MDDGDMYSKNRLGYTAYLLRIVGTYPSLSMNGIRRFVGSILFILSLRNGAHTSLKSELEVPSTKLKLLKFSTHALSLAGSPLIKKLLHQCAQI